MQLTRTTDYGVRLMMCLAERPSSTQSVAALAADSGVSAPLAAKLLQALVRAHLVRSHRGRRGGFALARVPATISLFDIVHGLESTMALNACLEAGEDACGRRSWCAAHLVWADAQARMVEVLARASLASLVDQSVARRAAAVPVRAVS